MEYLLAQKDDAKEIVKIHKQEIAGGFLSSLPAKFLEKLYTCVIENDFCVVAEDNGKVAGFIAGTSDIKKLYSNFIKKYFFVSVFLLLPRIFDIKKIFETLFYPKKENNLPQAELLTIAVKKEFQKQGLAGQMLELFVKEAGKRGLKNFKVLVGSSLLSAIKFYEKNGFKLQKEVQVHGKEKSLIYIYDLSN